MQTTQSLLIALLLATITFASPIFSGRHIRRDFKDIGHNVGGMMGGVAPPQSASSAFAAPSGVAAPSLWKGDMEWHAHKTGVAAPSAEMPIATGMPKHGLFNRSLPIHFPKVPVGTGFPHKAMPVPSGTGLPVFRRMAVNSTSGVWPSGAVVPSGSSWPSGAAFPSSMGTAFSTSAPSSAPTGFLPMHKKVWANSTSAEAAFPTASAPQKFAPSGTAPAMKAADPKMTFPTGTAPVHKPFSTGTAPVSEHAPMPTGTMTIQTHMHLPTDPAMVSVTQSSSSASAAAAASSAAPSTHAVEHSPETKAAVSKSPGSPCSPDEASQCHGESMYGHCQYSDGHWRWYWTDVDDGNYCKDGTVFKPSGQPANTYSWKSSPSDSHSWSKRLDSILSTL